MTSIEGLLRAKFPPVSEDRGESWKARCPNHDDRHPSLSVKRKDDGAWLVTCFVCKDRDAVLASVGLTWRDLKPAPPAPVTPLGRIVEAYPYTDYVDGREVLLYEAVRYDPKDFRPRRPDGCGGWITKGKVLDGVKRVPYRLPDILTSSPDALIFSVEGEKDANRLASLGLVATTTVGGAQSFGASREATRRALTHRHVVILSDADAAGDVYRETRVSALRDVAASVRVVTLPRLPHTPDHGADVSDWLDAPYGGTRDELLRLVENTPPIGGIEAALLKDAHPPIEDAHTPRLEHLNTEPHEKGAEAADLLKDAQTVGYEHLNEQDSEQLWQGGVLLSDVQPEAIEWLWAGYIPLRKITMGDGDPGEGKTLLYAADLAARVSTGRQMPDETAGLAGPAGVVIFTAEDDPADTLLPRLQAAGGDPARALVVTTMTRHDPETGKLEERLPTFADLGFIERKIQEAQARLVVFDPFMAYLPSASNAHRDQDIRAILAPLSRLAQKTGAAFLLIRHLNKGNFANALYRGGGSIGIIGAARSGLLVVRHPDDESLRIFGSSKSNLGRPMPSLQYRIVENDEGIPHIQWEGVSERSASDVLNATQGERQTASKLDQACDALREALADGAKAEEEVKALTQAQGVSNATLRRAKTLLGVESVRQGYGKNGRWVWDYPQRLNQRQDTDASKIVPFAKREADDAGGFQFDS